MRNKSTKKRKTFQLEAPEAQAVYLAGSFNHWDPHARPLKRDGKGVWQTRVSLEPGVHEYRFVVDGTWQDDPQCEEHRPNGWGGTNCVVHV